MSAGCDGHPAQGRDLDPRFRRALTIALSLNVLMLVVEVAAGLQSGSLALLADAVDFLGDSVTYGLSLAVLALGLKWRARAAVLKGILMAGFGLAILAGGVARAQSGSPPEAPVMGLVGMAALAVNITAALVLMRHRNGDSNRRSVWLCSRNDALGNIAVVAAAGGVAATGSHWPDLVVGVGIALLALYSAQSIIRHALSELTLVHASFSK